MRQELGPGTSRRRGWGVGTHRARFLWAPAPHFKAAWMSSWLKTSLCRPPGAGQAPATRDQGPDRPPPHCGPPVLRDEVAGVRRQGHRTLRAQHLGETGRGRPSSRRGSGWAAHLGVAASDLDHAVADGQEKLHHAVGVPVLSLHQGPAQGQPHVAGQEVLTVLPGGPAARERASGPAPAGHAHLPPARLGSLGPRPTRGRGIDGAN